MIIPYNPMKCLDGSWCDGFFPLTSRGFAMADVVKEQYATLSESKFGDAESEC